MGGRGASSSAINRSASAFQNVDANVKSLLGKQGRPLTPEEALQTTNPHYNSGAEKWRINCQRVVYAYEAQRRGYQVEAQPNIRKPGDNMSRYGYRNMFEDQTWEGDLGSRNKTVERNIESAMREWGDGARAIVKVDWKSGKSAHVFNIEQSGGKTVAYDAQSGKSIKLMDYLQYSKPTKTEISRVDNLNKINSNNWSKAVMPYGDYRE